MTSDPPGWRTVDPGTGSTDPILPDAPTPGETLVIAAESSEDDRSWATQVTAAAIREWSGTTDRLFVMDLDFRGVGVREALGARAAEGVSDLLLFGASLSRVVQTLEGDAVHFVPPGTPVASSREVLAHARWSDVVRSFEDAGAVLVLYLPVDQAGSASILARADRIVRLGRPSGTGRRIPAEALHRVAASLAPLDADLDMEVMAEAPEEDVTLEAGAGISGESFAAAGEQQVPEEAGARGVESPWPGPVVDIRDLAPEPDVVDIEDLAPDQPDQAGASRSPVPPGPVVDIADLAPDEPVGIARSAEDEMGIPEDEFGVEGAYPEFPEEPSPEAEAGDEVVPFGPDAGEVEEEAPAPGAEDFEEESFAEGLDAIDAAAEAGKQSGLSDFDLEELDALAENIDGGHGEAEEAGDELGAEAEEPGSGDRDYGDESFEGEGQLEEPTLEGREGQQYLEEGDLGEDALEEMPLEETPGGDEAFEGEGVETGREQGVGAGGFEAEGPEEPGSAPAEEEEVEDALAFEGFSGELDVLEEEVAEDQEAVAGSGPVGEGDFGGVEEGVVEPEAEDDLGADLVTGPDFGQGSPEEEEEIWGGEPDETEGGEEAGTTGAGTAAGGGTHRRDEPRPGPGEGGPGGDEAGGEDARATEAPLVGVDSGESRDRTRGRPLRLMALLVLLVVGAVAAHWYDVIDVPGLDRALSTVLGPAGTGTAPTVETVGIQPTSPIQARSLLVDTYRDAQSAADVALALRGRLPDRVFAVAPVQADGDVTFQLLAGPANTGEEAAELRRTLAGVLTREDPSAWTPRETSLAFLIDETDGLQAARARADAVTSDGVFAYVLRVTYPDEATAYRVYAGGYADPDQARALRGILSQADVEATFTERRGEIPE